MNSALLYGPLDSSPSPLGGAGPELPPELVTAAVRVLEARHRRLQESRAEVHLGPERIDREELVDPGDEPLETLLARRPAGRRGWDESD